MIEDPVYKSFKNETNSFELSSEKPNKSMTNNQVLTNSGELDTNIITIIKEIERKSSQQYSDSDSSELFLEKSSHRLMKEKAQLKKFGFIYIMIFIFLSFLHIFSAINTFVIFYTKELYFIYNRVLIFGIIGLVLNVIWFVSNFIVGCALLNKNVNLMVFSLYLLCFAFLAFLMDLSALIYIMQEIPFDHFGIKELVFLSFEGSFIIAFVTATNTLRQRFEKIKYLKSMELEV